MPKEMDYADYIMTSLDEAGRSSAIRNRPEAPSKLDRIITTVIGNDPSAAPLCVNAFERNGSPYTAIKVFVGTADYLWRFADTGGGAVQCERTSRDHVTLVRVAADALNPLLNSLTYEIDGEEFVLKRENTTELLPLLRWLQGQNPAPVMQLG